MDNRQRLTTFLTLTLMILSGFSVNLKAQDQSYQLIPAPDVWYNSVDGIRLGVRVLGEIEGTFKDGPHRLDAGLWLGTKFPDLPLSYFFSFTEPVPGLSQFGEEFNVRLISSIRTGYSQHRVSVNKRFQKGFDERRYQEISLFLSQEKTIENAYRLTGGWEEDWKTLAGIDLQSRGFTPAGELETRIRLQQNLNTVSGNFSAGSIELRHMTDLGKGFGLNLRTFSGLSSSDAPYEYGYSLANRAPINWLSNGLSRAKGTIPDSFFENGVVQIAGGMNLRGYTVDAFNNFAVNKDRSRSYVPYFNKTWSLNSEILFPNFINSLLKESIIGDFVHIKSYVFHDVGVYSAEDVYLTDIPEDISEVSADAGIGLQFSINIPDYLGKDRGFAIRYDMPFWLSDPDGLNAENVQPGSETDAFKFRGILGIGAVISL